MEVLQTDPFSLKGYPRWHPKRLLPTLVARLQERLAYLRFEDYQLPYCSLEELRPCPDYDKGDTAVTDSQMQHLLKAATAVNGGTIVEVGCYRGVTTRCLAEAVTPVHVIGVDPFIGWGGADDDYEAFTCRIAGLENVIHERCTSGEAARNWSHGSVKFVFIDAVHDYWNTSYDLQVWDKHLEVGGILAAHDTDHAQFAGTRRAVAEILDSRSYELYAHVENLTILQKVGAP